MKSCNTCRWWVGGYVNLKLEKRCHSVQANDNSTKSGQKPGSRLTRLLSNKSINTLIYKDKSPDQFSPKKTALSRQKVYDKRDQWQWVPYDEATWQELPEDL